MSSNIRPNTHKCMHLVTHGQWSLPVMWQWWRSHNLIHHSQKPQNACKVHGSMCVIVQKWSYCWSKFTLREYGFSTFSPHVSLTLTRRPSHTNLTPYSLEMYRMSKNELPMSRLVKVIVWQTCLQTETQPKLYTTPLCVCSIISK